MPKPDPKSRFSTRVEDYAKYRPGYPIEILDLFADECGLNPDSVIADIRRRTNVESCRGGNGGVVPLGPG